MGQPFSGIGFTGFNNYKKKFFSVWWDTAGTGNLVMEGTVDKTGKVFTFTGKMDDFIGKPVHIKSVTTVVDDKQHRFEMWMSGPDGKMFKSLEMIYTKK